MRPLAKIGLVAAGYIAALTLAIVVVMVYAAATAGSHRLTYGGMFAFGDSLLFLGVFGVTAVVRSGTALFFPRPYRTFWNVLSGIALVVAATAVGASLTYLASQETPAYAFAIAWSPMAVLRILIAPLVTLAFLVSAVLAPSRGPRLALLIATALEGLAFFCVALIWFSPHAR